VIAAAPSPEDVAARLRQAGYWWRRSSLPAVRQTARVRLCLATSRKPLDALLANFNRTFPGPGSARRRSGLAFGALLAQPVTTQVDRLVEAIDRVAHDDLAARVEVSRDDELARWRAPSTR